MQAYQGFNSIAAIYFSKENVSFLHFEKNQMRLSSGLIQYVVPTSQNILLHAMQQKSPQVILTNQDKHSYLVPVLNSIKIIKIDERGLQDDIIQNNVSVLKFNPIKEPINNKKQYIKMMRQHSEHCGLAKQKYKALGIMLYYLLNEDDASISNKLYINDIEYFSDMFKHVQITSSELQVFQIIKEEVHPSLIKGKGKSKQGFSLMSLYQTPLCSAGSKKILRNIFRNPTYDKKLLQSRLDLLTWIKRNCQDYRNLVKVFRTIHAIDTILHKFMDSRIENEDWSKFVKTMQSMVIVHKIIQQKIRLCGQNELPSFLDSFNSEINWPQIAKLLSTISSTLDLNEGTIKRGIDPQLDELKKTYDNLPHLLTLYARQQNWSQDCRIVFMAQIGYLIRVPHDIEIPEIEGEKWSLQFVKNSGKFYCNQLTSMLDNQYGDIYGEITDREKKINFQLQNLVSEHAETLQQAYWKICELQCYVGVSIVSNGMCRPRFSSQSLIVSKGWHILLAQQAIQNNAFSFNQMQAPKQRIFDSQQNIVNTNYSNRIMLITGPNGSGKTIYMKQIAIITFLAHLGFYVPAEFAEIPLLDRIILVQSKKSIYGSQNGFESEISSLSRITVPGLLTNKSLILVDELGASIDRIFAKKMLSALLQFLSEPNESNIVNNQYLSRPEDRFKIPLTIVITHLTDVMSQGLIKQSYKLRYLTMDMEKDETFLFKIKPGLVKKSYGIECAKSFMSEDFIKKAYKFWQEIKYKS